MQLLSQPRPCCSLAGESLLKYHHTRDSLVAGLARYDGFVITADIDDSHEIRRAPFPSPRPAFVDSCVVQTVLVLRLCHVQSHIAANRLATAVDVVIAGVVG